MLKVPGVLRGHVRALDRGDMLPSPGLPGSPQRKAVSCHRTPGCKPRPLWLGLGLALHLAGATGLWGLAVEQPTVGGTPSLINAPVSITNDDHGVTYDSLRLDSQLADMLWRAYGVAEHYDHDFAQFVSAANSDRIFRYQISSGSEVRDGWTTTVQPDGTIFIHKGIHGGVAFSTGKTMTGNLSFHRSLLDLDGDGRVNYTFDFSSNFTAGQLSHPLTILGEIGANLHSGHLIEAYDTSTGIFTAPGEPYALVATAEHPRIAGVVELTVSFARGETGPRLVTLSSASPGAQIRYRLDGATADADSPLYTGPFLLTRSAELSAVAFAPGLEPSFALERSIAADFDFSAWADWHGLEGDSAAPEADPHGRGVPNLLAYAFGIQEPGLPSPGMDGFGNPSSVSGTPAMEFEPDGPRLVLRFPVRRDAPGLVYEALFAPTPAGPWEPAPIALVPHDHHWSEATAEDPSPGEAKARFGKVRVSGEGD